MINDLLDKKLANEIIEELRERKLHDGAEILKGLKSLNITNLKTCSK